MGQLLGPWRVTVDRGGNQGGPAAKLGSKLVCHVAFADVCCRFGLASKYLQYETKTKFGVKKQKLW